MKSKKIVKYFAARNTEISADKVFESDDIKMSNNGVAEMSDAMREYKIGDKFSLYEVTFRKLNDFEIIQEPPKAVLVFEKPKAKK